MKTAERHWETRRHNTNPFRIHFVPPLARLLICVTQCTRCRTRTVNECNAHLLLHELAEHDNLVEAVEQLGAEEASQLVHHLLAHGHVRAAVGVVRGQREAQLVVPTLGDHLAAHVGGHHHQRVLKANHAALRVRQPPILQHLQPAQFSV